MARIPINYNGINQSKSRHSCFTSYPDRTQNNKQHKTFIVMCIMINILLLVASPVYSEQKQNPSSKVLLDEIHKALSSIRTLEADFIQTRRLAIFEDELISEGKLYYNLPDQMRWEIKKPYRSALIFNQNNVAKFEIQKGQLRKMKIAGEALFSEIMGQMMHIMKGDFSAIEKEYAIHAEQGENITVSLTPRSQKLSTILNSFTFTMHPETFRVKKLKLQEGSEDDIEIVFQHEKENGTLDPSLFSMKNPCGFEIEILK